ncbi:sensor histidine kinase [Rariglobus hedericola]|uniref:histidine kinase n=1 Tax=Rariglobus hedericola TaxID=2597822 RepID=A0A556QJ50_9BACT|nr:ATP-binding protein [Rariglobus hedericola]TSJ76631.1 PAS domain S-box protein [Rariglobus hedericola]
MFIFLTIALTIALGITLLKALSHRRAVSALQQAIFRKQLLLSEDLPGAAGPAWERLRLASNELITEVGQLQQQRTGQLAQLEATLGSLQEAVLIVDASNYILLANKALQAISPRASNQIIGHRLELVLHSVAFLTYVESVRLGKAQPQQEVEFSEDGHTTWLEVTGTTIQSQGNSRGPWTLFVLHDITKQKKLESIRKDFVANVSHELRTPLSVIKGYVETLVDGHHDIPVDDRERFLKTIQRHTERLNSLLEDLLVLSRLESINPGLHRESVNLQTLLTDIIDDYHGRPSASGHTLDLSVDPAIGLLLIDPLKVTQVVENLLDNALKYTGKGSRIELSARLQGLGEIIVSLRDNGPGIPAEDLPHLFERFYRVDKGRSRDKGGTGLGLSIVKHIVQLHGGRVWVESKQGQGTTFHFSLPLRTNGHV